MAAFPEGAYRLATVMFILEMLLWFCRTHLVPGVERVGSLVLAASTSLFVSALTRVLYLALEPWVRRRWPQTIISWSRLLSGQFRDPLVGRDILFSTMLGNSALALLSVIALAAWGFYHSLGGQPVWKVEMD
jgi:serine/threonine-protein kinase